MSTEVQKHMSKLGFKAKDKVTGFEGVITSVAFDLYGCIQYIVCPFAASEGKLESSRYFDVARVEVKGKKPVMPQPDFVDGPVAEGRKGPAEKPPTQGAEF